MFKNKLKKLRISKGLTQQQLADKLYVSRSAIAKWEQGRGLPHEEMIHALEAFFNVNKNYFYDKDESNKLIEMLFKRSRVYKGLGLVLAVGLIISVTIFIFNLNNTPKIIRNEFYSNAYIEKMHLDGLENVPNNQNNSILYQGSYHINMDSFDQFENYVAYVYAFLQNSFDVSYIGFGIHTAIDFDYDTRDKNDLIQYIKRSDRLTDYANHYNNSVSYTFYYLTSDHTKHQSGEQINPYVISLNYSYNITNLGWGFKIDDALEVTNFYMTIHKAKFQSSKNYQVGFYMFDDYFHIVETTLNSTNIFNYFTMNLSEDSDHYRILIVPNTFMLKYYFDIHLIIHSDDYNLSKNYIITRHTNTIKINHSELNDADIEDIKPYINMIVENGYFYQITPKS